MEVAYLPAVIACDVPPVRRDWDAAAELRSRGELPAARPAVAALLLLPATCPLMAVCRLKFEGWAGVLGGVGSGERREESKGRRRRLSEPAAGRRRGGLGEWQRQRQQWQWLTDGGAMSSEVVSCNCDGRVARRASVC